MEVSGRDNQTRQTRATTRRRNEQAEKPVRSNQTNTRRPCPYYLRSRIQEKDRIHEDLNNIEINGIPGSTFRRRSLSMEALNGDPVHRILQSKSSSQSEVPIDHHTFISVMQCSTCGTLGHSRNHCSNTQACFSCSSTDDHDRTLCDA
ncbi:hypothetical protein TNCV_3984191 [Trichonephila clavipes]|nr:hypothetical protein TNCV_3984191 [Trichonephila clavipes]